MKDFDKLQYRGGATLINTLAVADLPAGGNIGAAAATVDILTSFNLNQTTAGQTITLPNPTDVTAGRQAVINNVGTQSFTLYTGTIPSQSGATLMWDGNSWNLTGADPAAGVRISALLPANAINTIDNTNFTQTWDWSTITTGRAIDITNSGNTITTGTLLRVNTASTGAHGGNGVVIFNSNGAHTGFFHNVLSNTLTGVAMNVTSNTITSGRAFQVNSSSGTQSGEIVQFVGGSATATGRVLDVTSVSTAAGISNGLVRFNFTGNHGGSGFQIDDVTTGAQIVNINANSLTGGTGLVVSSSSVGLTSNLARLSLTGNNVANTGNVLLLQNTGATSIAKTLDSTQASTGNLATGGARFNFTGNHTGTGLLVSDVTTAGTAMQVNATALTTGVGLGVTTNGVGSAILRLGNSTGTNDIFRTTATPEAVITATRGDLAMFNDGTTGALYIKSSGAATTTLWKRFPDRASFVYQRINALGAGSTRYIAVAGSNADVALGAETNIQVATYASIVSGFKVRILTNATGANSTITFRVNAANTALTVTVPAATTGVFTATGAITVAADGLLSYGFVTGAGGALTPTSIITEYNYTT